MTQRSSSRPHRSIVAPVHIGCLHGVPVRFFAALRGNGYPWFAVHDFFEAVQTPADSHLKLVRIGRETTPEAIETLPTAEGVTLVAQYGYGRGLLELIQQAPGFEEIVREFDLAARLTVEATAG